MKHHKHHHTDVMPEHHPRHHLSKENSAHYEHGMDKPHTPSHGHQEHGMGVHDMKGQAQQIAYGQAGEQGCKSDSKKMSAQFKNYHWDSDTGGASGY